MLVQLLIAQIKTVGTITYSTNKGCWYKLLIAQIKDVGTIIYSTNKGCWYNDL